jgi:VanZ family protein
MNNFILSLKASTLAKVQFWLACVVITILALSPVELVQNIFNWWDKAQHGLAFFALACMGLFAYPYAHWRMAFGLLAFGITIEILQYLTGWRFAELSDVLADVLGISLALVAMWSLQKLLKN